MQGENDNKSHAVTQAEAHVNHTIDYLAMYELLAFIRDQLESLPAFFKMSVRKLSGVSIYAMIEAINATLDNVGVPHGYDDDEPPQEAIA